MQDKTIKFVFDYWPNHYTIRFAWRPLYLLEQLYIKRWGEDFAVVYELARNNPDELTAEQKQLLGQCIKDTSLFLECLQSSPQSPIVVYVTDKI